jgi:hypothetical protein
MGADMDSENGTPDVPTMPTDVAELVDTKVDPITPRLAEPTPPAPPTPPIVRRVVDTDPGTPIWWYVGIGAVVLGLGVIAWLEIRDRTKGE